MKHLKLRATGAEIDLLSRLERGGIGLHLPRAFVNQFGLLARRGSRIDNLQVVASDRNGPRLLDPRIVRIRAGLKAYGDGFIRLVNCIPTPTGDAPVHPRLVFFWRALQTVLRRKFRNIGARDIC